MDDNVGVRAILLSLSLTFAVAGFCLETALITPAELRSRVLMTPLSDFTRFSLSVRTPDFVMTSREVSPQFSLRGRDKRGRHWQVILRDASRGAWQSDVRGRRTYYFAGYTGAAGSGPPTWILALSFDDDGQPVPFILTTHGSYDAKGIVDVLDLDGSGPELLEQSYWGNLMQDPGYYVTTLYQQRGVYWYRSDGRHGAHVFPAFEKWSAIWKDRRAELVNDPPNKQAVRDASNDPAMGIRTRIIGVGEHTISVSPETGCDSVTVGALVTDSVTGRKIDLEPAMEEFAILGRGRTTIVATGLYHWPGGNACDASIVWARTGH